MRITIFFFIIFCLGNVANGQVKTKLIEPADTTILRLPRLVSDQVLRSNFYSVEVMDCRSDTGSLGYYYSTFYWKNKMYVFQSSVASQLADWVADYLKIGNGMAQGHLVMCLKKLRLSNEATTIIYAHGHQGKPINGWEQGLIIKAEFYLKKDNDFYPLYRYDSTITLDTRFKNDIEDFIPAGLRSSLTKIFTIDIKNVIAKGNKISRTELEKYNKKTAELNILNEVVYKKGVYKNFQEFISNSPSIADFEYKKAKKGDAIYIKDASGEYLYRNAWGFSDGKDLYINSADKYFQLIREGNAFYFNGMKSITRKSVHVAEYTSAFNLMTNTGVKKTVYKTEYKYYQVDMETGDVY